MSRLLPVSFPVAVIASLIGLIGKPAHSASYIVENATAVSPPWTSASMEAISATGTVAGYFSYSQNVRGAQRTYTSAFIYDERAKTFTNIGSSFGGSSVATCVSASGDVAGVCWIPRSLESYATAQSGFVVHNGRTTTFLSPAGGDISAVTSVNSLGHVSGTYYGASGYMRSFIWDGINSTDLGDPAGFGDSGSNYVWPSALNEADQIVGTVYDFNGPKVQYGAYVWKDGIMSPVDQEGDYGNSTGIALNDFGSALSNYVVPNYIHHGFQTGGFMESGGELNELGDLGGAGTASFSLNNNGLVTGTSYAASGALHLFTWTQSGMVDKGFAGLRKR